MRILRGKNFRLTVFLFYIRIQKRNIFVIFVIFTKFSSYNLQELRNNIAIIRRLFIYETEKTMDGSTYCMDNSVVICSRFQRVRHPFASSKMIQEKNSKYTTGAGAIAAANGEYSGRGSRTYQSRGAESAGSQRAGRSRSKTKSGGRSCEKAAEEAARAQIAAEDQKLLASIIFCEAGNQPYEGQVAVGAVIMNRVRSGVYPNSISEVIYQSGQFSPAMSGWLDRVRANAGYSESALQAAEDALNGSNPVGDCLYFSTGGYGMQIGDHFFH